MCESDLALNFLEARWERVDRTFDAHRGLALEPIRQRLRRKRTQTEVRFLSSTQYTSTGYHDTTHVSPEQLCRLILRCSMMNRSIRIKSMRKTLTLLVSAVLI